MSVAIYWAIRILSWLGLIYFLYSIIRPQGLIQFIIKAAGWKMACFGFKIDIKTTPQTESRMRIWSLVMALVFAGLVYVFAEIIVLGYVIK